MTERDIKISHALGQHHMKVSMSYDAIMTVLVGSQNYDLDTDKSDFDTFTFVLPRLQDISMLAEPVSTTIEDELGHINIKDIRLALNLLKKTSPNSAECFCFKHAYVSDAYADILQALKSPYVLRCDTRNMMTAIGGMANQLSKRNMPAGKRLSHMIRMWCMAHSYFDINADILSLTNEERELALQAKLDPDNPKWEKMLNDYASAVKEAVGKADLSCFDTHASQAKDIVNNVQMELLKKKFNVCTHYIKCTSKAFA